MKAFKTIYLLIPFIFLIEDPNYQAHKNADLQYLPMYKRLPNDSLLERLLLSQPAAFSDIIKSKEELNVQIIYTQIDRSKKDGSKIRFTDQFYNLQPENYFYPASTVKLPVAILALQRLHELRLSKDAIMITGKQTAEQTAVEVDSSSANKKPSVAHYIKKILLVSDNDAFNRLYEFLGQEYINNELHKRGYSNTQIIHRLSISLNEEQNRQTNPVSFYDDNGKLLYSKPPSYSSLMYALRNTKVGSGFMQGDKLVNEPLDFSKKNRLILMDLHEIVRSIMFPEAVEKSKRFNLSNDDYDFLRMYMSMKPSESISPKYDTTEFWDNFVKFVYYGSEKKPPENNIRIFGKTGTAYGYLIESCYFADFSNNIEFMLSAVIYCNSDGILNDDRYDYDSLGYPFFKNLGRLIYDFERTRKRKIKPDLSAFNYNYKDQK